MKINKFYNLLSLLVVLIFALIYSLENNYFFYHADEPGHLIWGRYIWQNPGLIFSFSSLSRQFPFFRPIQRIVWAVNAHFFSINSIPIQILGRTIFILIIFFIYKTTCLISNWGGGVMAAILFLFFPQTHFFFRTPNLDNVLFELLFLILTINFYIKSLYTTKKNFFVFTVIFITLACLSREVAIFIFVGITGIAFLSRENFNFRTLKGYLIFSLILLIYLILYLWKIKFYQYYPEVSDVPISTIIRRNCTFYIETILGINFVLILASIIFFSLLTFKNSYHQLFLGWIGAALIPLFLYRRQIEYFILEAYLGISLYLGATFGLFGSFVSKSIANKEISNIFKSKLLFLTVAFFFLFPILFSNYVQTVEIIKANKNHDLLEKMDRVIQLLLIPKDSQIYVDREEAFYYVDQWLEFFGRKNIKAKTLDFSTIEQIRISENLISNSFFENYSKEKNITLISASLEEGYSLKVSKPDGIIINYDGPSQLIQLKPNQYYAFGGWIRTFKHLYGATVEIREEDNKYYWGTKQINGTSDWTFVGRIFKTPAHFCRVKFYTPRIPLYFSGDVFVKNAFLYEITPQSYFEY